LSRFIAVAAEYLSGMRVGYEHEEIQPVVLPAVLEDVENIMLCPLRFHACLPEEKLPSHLEGFF
jgi:hypothetical protein